MIKVRRNSRWMKTWSGAAGALAVVLGSTAAVQAIPVPRAYYDFEEGTGQTFTNRANPGRFDGYLGSSPSNATNDPAWISPGLDGSGAALTDDSSVGQDIATVENLVTDPGDDGQDDDVFHDSFSVFVRVKLPSAKQAAVVSAGDTPSDRGWYLDFMAPTATTGEDADNMRVRFNAQGYFVILDGNETTDYQNIHSYGMVFTPDSDPSNTATEDGSIQLYINGSPFGSAQHHNLGYARVGNGDFIIGDTYAATWRDDEVIDDVAVWDTALTDAQMQAVNDTGVPVPEPGSLVLLGVSGLVMLSRKRRGGNSK